MLFAESQSSLMYLHLYRTIRSAACLASINRMKKRLDALPAGRLLTPRLDTLFKSLSMWVLLLSSSQPSSRWSWARNGWIIAAFIAAIVTDFNARSLIFIFFWFTARSTRDARRMQMPWDVWILLCQNMLDAFAQFPRHRWLAKGPIRWSVASTS